MCIRDRWCCYLYYGPVNIDGFAIGSIMNQGFRDYSVNGVSGYGDLTNSNGLLNSITLGVDAVFDQSILKLKWFVDGIEKPEYENMLSVTFERPSDNNWVSYSYQIEDLSGNLFAPNDPLSPTDFLNALVSYLPPVFIFDTTSTTFPIGIPLP